MTNEPLASSHTAHKRPGLMRMGRTSGQRSAELIAAFHALLTPTPETLALSRPTGRFLARMIRVIARNEPALNMIPNRRGTITHLIQDYLTEHPGSRVVEVAAGLSPRGLVLGKAFPQCDYIEIDLPDVIATKHERLSRHKLIPPPNLQFVEANLVDTPLVQVLRETNADLVVAEGLLLYFSPDEAVAIMASLLPALKPGGMLVVDIFNRTVIRNLLNASHSRIAYGLFMRVTGKFQGMVDELDEAHSWVERAGGTDAALHLLSETAPRYGLLQPVTDIAFIATCRKPEGETS